MNKFYIFLIIQILLFNSCRVKHSSNELFNNEISTKYFQKAQDLIIANKRDSALIYFNKADSIAPNTAIILHERGLLKSHLTSFEDALVDINKSIELTTDEKQKQIRIANRGNIYMEMGNKDKACEDWHNAGKWGKSSIKKFCE